MVFFVILLIAAAFGLGVFVGYKVPHEVKLLAAPKKQEPITPTSQPRPSQDGVSDVAKKLAEEYRK